MWNGQHPKKQNWSKLMLPTSTHRAGPNWFAAQGEFFNAPPPFPPTADIESWCFTINDKQKYYFYISGYSNI